MAVLLAGGPQQMSATGSAFCLTALARALEARYELQNPALAPGLARADGKPALASAAQQPPGSGHQLAEGPAGALVTGL